MADLVMMEFEGDISSILQEMKDNFMKPLFAPQLAEERLYAKPDSRLWQRFYTAPSLVATGKTRKGNAVTVFVHAENYLMNPKNASGRIRYGTVPVAEDAFLRYVSNEDDKTVFVRDFKALENAPQVVSTLEEAISHPAMIPIFGTIERATAYLQIWKPASDKKNEEMYKILPRHGEFFGKPDFYGELHDAMKLIHLPWGNPLFDHPSGWFIYLNGIGSNTPASYGGFDPMASGCFLAESKTPPRLPKLKNLIPQFGF
jgi:hypothetical protein